MSLAAAAFGPMASAQDAAALPANIVTNASGFLQDHTRLTPVPGKDGRYAWAAPDGELRAYKNFILLPMEILIDRDAQNRGLPADVVQRIADIYQTSFARVLAPEYPVVKQPSPGVASCRFAITGVSPERPNLTPLDFVPIETASLAPRTAASAPAEGRQHLSNQ
jgi:hypothetical protein